MIFKAKEESWKNLISMIDEDLWGIPYKLVMGKLNPAAPSLTKILNQSDLIRLINDLFPRNKEKGIINNLVLSSWKEEWDVS